MIVPRIVTLEVFRGLSIQGYVSAGYVGDAYSSTFSAINGIPPFTWSLAGALPPSMTFANSGSSATITSSSITPSDVGTWSIVLNLRDATRSRVQKTFQIKVIALPLVITNSAPSGSVGTAYSFTYTKSGGDGAVTWSYSGSLPSGLTLSSSGVLSGTPTAGGSYSYVVIATDSVSTVAARNESVSIVIPPLSLSGSFASPLYDGVAYSQSMSITGGVPPYSNPVVVTGALPQGLSLSISGSSLVLSGTCTHGVTSTFTVRVQDSTSTQATSSGQSLTRQDQYFSSVVSLLHFNGANGSQVFTDQKGKTWSAYGSAQLDTLAPIFGTASLYPFFASSTDHIETPSSTDFNFGTGDFTIEWWQNWTTHNTPNYQCPFMHGYNVAGGITVVTGNADGKYAVYFGTLSLVCVESTGGPTNTPVHYALTRHGTTVTLWRDGVASATGTSSENLGANAIFSIGGYSSDSGALGQAFNGRMDESRATKGVARYTLPFTPPADEFPNS